jgi:hypothetical protein
MAAAQKQRRRRQIQFNPRSCNRKKRGNVVFTRRSQRYDFRINELFTRKPGLGQKPPHTRMKPEHGSQELLNNRHQPILATNVQQFVTRNSVL